ncbi:LPS export ABC transporter periplasmic protein LptC [uncultured Sulfitobacter sp.]|uniref:LPS export ABC transporter periplasmic protein LptC n=1 Tax=uncultured Sulfitobacter sp. TaxID=191468 RepID=UPI002616B142|nr:LPS export ABC transporter periplasmic protein LptC [uncultured Sulfitobacter sp.]
METDRYTRMVFWLKILFPLSSLGILSTLFLLSRSVDPETAIPFADKEVQDRLRDQQVTGPFFSGATADGDEISFSADVLVTPQGETGANRAEEVKVAMDLASGGRITMDADEAQLNLSENFAELTGEVTIITSTGYRIESDMLRATLTEIEISSPGPVHATGPGGTLDAGAMDILAQDGENPTQLVFKNGVKLIYDPKQIEERPEE